MSSAPRASGERWLTSQNMFTAAMALVGVMSAYSAFQRDVTGDISVIKARLEAMKEVQARHEREIDRLRDRLSDRRDDR